MNSKIDSTILRLGKFLENFTGVGGEVKIIKPLPTCRDYIGVGYNEKNKIYRFAAISIRTGYPTPIYYYDISKKALEESNYEEVCALLNRAVLSSFVTIENSEAGNFKVTPEHKVWSIFNLLMVQAIRFYTTEPYLNGHTSYVNIERFLDKPEDTKKMLTATMIEDKEGHIKNIINEEVCEFDNLKEREDYIEKHYDRLINIVE